MHISLGAGSTGRIGHAHFARRVGAIRRIGHALSAMGAGTTSGVEHAGRSWVMDGLRSLGTRLA